MYELMVYHPGDRIARVTVKAARAADAFALIPLLLAEHDGCEHIVVMVGGVRLFSVDCAGIDFRASPAGKNGAPLGSQRVYRQASIRLR